MALLEIFAESPSPSGPHAVDDTGMDFPELTLLDEAEMQDQVELSRALQLAMHATDAALSELNTLVSAARGLRSVQPERNPLRPEKLHPCRAKVVAETGVLLPVRQLWMAHARSAGQLAGGGIQKRCRQPARAGGRTRRIHRAGYACR